MAAPLGNTNATKRDAKATKWLQIRLTLAQDKTLRQRARIAKRPLAKYVRQQLRLD